MQSLVQCLNEAAVRVPMLSLLIIGIEKNLAKKPDVEAWKRSIGTLEKILEKIKGDESMKAIHSGLSIALGDMQDILKEVEKSKATSWSKGSVAQLIPDFMDRLDWMKSLMEP